MFNSSRTHRGSDVEDICKDAPIVAAAWPDETATDASAARHPGFPLQILLLLDFCG